MPDAVTGTIFDADLPASHENAYLRQRRCGLFILHDVNPLAIAEGDVTVERIGDDLYRVVYLAIWLPEGQSQWVTSESVNFTPPRSREATPFPVGVLCQHGEQSHKVVQRRWFTAGWDEIALTPESRMQVLGETKTPTEVTA